MSARTLDHAQVAPVPGAPALPQVNLLPPEIRAGRAFGQVRSWLVIGVLGVILVAGLLMVWSTAQVSSAKDELAETQDQNAALQRQQNDYAEVPQVLNQVTAVTDARTFAMGPEILWKPFVSAIAATAPGGVSINTMSLVYVSNASATNLNAVGSPFIGTITFEAESLTLPDTAAWLDGLSRVHGLSDPWFSDASVAEENGIKHYVVSGTVNVTYDALALRFLATTEGK